MSGIAYIDLAILAIGLLAYTASVVACCNVERDHQWRTWIDNHRPKFGPDGRDLNGTHRRDYAADNKRRTKANEDESW